jgi:primosomal protein N' (replication factor Y)
VPEHLAGEIRVGTAVVAPLSGYSRLGIVVGFEEEVGDRPLKEIRAVAEGLSLPESLVRLCGWTAGAAALPPHAVLRMALPPGLETSTYEVRHPAPGWPWKAGSVVGRVKLRQFLGGDDLKAAETTGRIAFSPIPPPRQTVEWAIADEKVKLELLRRAPRQKALLEALTGHDRGRPVANLLSAAGASRDALKRLIGRGAVRLEKRPEPTPVRETRGSGAGLTLYVEGAKKALSRGGAWVWRMPSSQSVAAVAAVARTTIGRGEQILVLAPEIERVERLVEAFEGLLPAGLTVAPYYSGMGRGRAMVYEAARRGEVDVLVGTRAAALSPMARLGAVCVVDEPNEAHRASLHGYEGVPIHVRDLARARGRIEGAAVFFFSPYPSLRLYAPESGTQRLPPIEPTRWPAVAVVDMRGTGATLSSTLIDACRQTIHSGGRVGVAVNRLGHAAIISCNRCGFLCRCPACVVPLSLHGAVQGVPSGGVLFCAACGHKESVANQCPGCGSDRLGGVGLAIGRVRKELANALDVEVGLVTASEREGEEAPVVTGTARCVLREGEWDLVVVPDADSLLFGGGTAEKGFRLLHGAAESSRARLLVQTRSPEHYALKAALQGDYEAFAAVELPKRRALGYPPHAYLAQVSFKGSEDAARRAVESRLRPALARSGVELLDPVPVAAHSGGGGRPVWRVLLRSRKRGALVEAAALVARLAAGTRGRGKLEACIDMDPEEV